MKNVSNDGKVRQILLESIRSLTRVNLGMEVRRLSDISHLIPTTQHTIASQLSEASCADDTVLENFISDLRFNEGPTAPNLSLIEMNNKPEGGYHCDQHQFSTD